MICGVDHNVKCLRLLSSVTRSGIIAAESFHHSVPAELKVNPNYVALKSTDRLRKTTFKFLHSNSLFKHSSIRSLSVNKAFSKSTPKSIIKSGCRQGGRGEPK